MKESKNRIFDLFLYGVLCIIFIVLFFVLKPYDRKPVYFGEHEKTSTTEIINGGISK